MDFVTLFALSAILACTVSNASVRSQEAESQVTGALRIVKGAGPINVKMRQTALSWGPAPVRFTSNPLGDVSPPRQAQAIS